MARGPTWLKAKSISILSDECPGYLHKKELSICCRWFVDGRPEEHFFLTVWYTSVKATNAQTIANAIISFISDKNLEYSRLVGLGYEVYTVFIHCSCHPLQLASIQAAQSVSVWKEYLVPWPTCGNCFTIHQIKAETLKHVQVVLNLLWVQGNQA